ncbi:MAG: hypothetical protein IPK79_07500 [Vampirovibrionales bacterium]|nr:hypothetical protein [Vampirovibrionales bacterium]
MNRCVVLWTLAAFGGFCLTGAAAADSLRPGAFHTGRCHRSLERPAAPVMFSQRFAPVTPSLFPVSGQAPHTPVFSQRFYPVARPIVSPQHAPLTSPPSRPCCGAGPQPFHAREGAPGGLILIRSSGGWRRYEPGR